MHPLTNGLCSFFYPLTRSSAHQETLCSKVCNFINLLKLLESTVGYPRVKKANSHRIFSSKEKQTGNRLQHYLLSIYTGVSKILSHGQWHKSYLLSIYTGVSKILSHGQWHKSYCISSPPPPPSPANPETDKISFLLPITEMTPSTMKLKCYRK